MTRRIAVVTGTRADYGLLRWLMADLRADPRVELAVIVTGTHLVADFGHTVDELIGDGFEIAASVPILEDDDTELGVARAMGRATIGIGEALARIRPDLLVVLGDRFEVLAAAQAALVQRIPVAHLHGGELTTGAVDDSIRHAVTKFSQLHFVAAEEYRRRVIQLGERPERVELVGALGLDGFERLELLDEDALAESLGYRIDHPLALVTFHPETLDGVSAETALEPLLAALAGRPALQLIITKANADAGGRAINEALQRFADARNASGAAPARLHASLGQTRYLSALRIADVVIGNSSSGILEAPTAGTPTIDIGQRQAGRLRAPSVINVPSERAAIDAAIQRALSDEFQTLADAGTSPFGTPGASQRVASRLATVPLDGLLSKGFYDLEYGGAS